MAHRSIRRAAILVISAAACGGEPDPGGAGAAGATFLCPDGAESIRLTTRDTVAGSNGVFVDHCDSAGNLVAYQCELASETVCGDFDCDEYYYLTEVVAEVAMDCAGTCKAGACESRCPNTGDVLQYSGPLAGGQHAVKNVTQGWSYHCETLSDGCTLPANGAQKTVEYKEARDHTCMGGDHAAVGFHRPNLGPNEVDCVFRCTADAPAP